MFSHPPTLPSHAPLLLVTPVSPDGIISIFMPYVHIPGLIYLYENPGITNE